MTEMHLNVEAPEPPIDQLVALYIQCRDFVKDANAKHEEKIANKKLAMRQIEGILQSFLTNTGQIRGAAKTGSFYTKTKYSATIKDKKEFIDYVLGCGNADLVDWKANAVAARDFEKENGAKLPGVEITAVASIGVRRPGADQNED
jgi:hypothetical protein